MRIFDDSEQWNEKVNFVDEDNVFVGYDLSQGCCEDANWFFSDEIILDPTYQQLEDSSQEIEEVETYFFDKDFFQSSDGGGDLDGGGIAVFKVVRKIDDKIKYLHIYNSHNGYYGHGFEFKINDEIKQEGCL